MASSSSKIATFEIFPSDRDLVECAELYRTWLIETNSDGQEQAQFLRNASIGVLVKMMAKSVIVSGALYSIESLADAGKMEGLSGLRRGMGG